MANLDVPCLKREMRMGVFSTVRILEMPFFTVVLTVTFDNLPRLRKREGGEKEEGGEKSQASNRTLRHSAYRLRVQVQAEGTDCSWSTLP